MLSVTDIVIKNTMNAGSHSALPGGDTLFNALVTKVAQREKQREEKLKGEKKVEGDRNDQLKEREKTFQESSNINKCRIERKEELKKDHLSAWNNPHLAQSMHSF